jgi:hypothetical protein
MCMRSEALLRDESRCRCVAALAMNSYVYICFKTHGMLCIIRNEMKQTMKLTLNTCKSRYRLARVCRILFHIDGTDNELLISK